MHHIIFPEKVKPDKGEFAPPGDFPSRSRTAREIHPPAEGGQ